MLHILLYPFIVAAFLGFVMSLTVHVAALLGFEAPTEAFALHIGIFVVWIPTVLVSSFTHRHHWGSHSWRDQLVGSPQWMKVVAYGLFTYAFLNFFGTLSGLFWSGPFSTLRLFSGHWMLFYWFAFATLYGVLHRPRAAQCLAGHTVSPGDRFCPKCGQPVAE